MSANPLQLDGGKVILWFDGGAVETFNDSYDKSFRTPAAWVAVQLEARKNDRVRFTVGRADPLGGQIYGSDAKLGWIDTRFELDLTEEPAVREFFTLVAQAAGRL